MGNSVCSQPAGVAGAASLTLDEDGAAKWVGVDAVPPPPHATSVDTTTPATMTSAIERQRPEIRNAAPMSRLWGNYCSSTKLRIAEKKSQSEPFTPARRPSATRGAPTPFAARRHNARLAT